MSPTKLTCGSILKPLPTVAGGNLPTFGVMIPKKVGLEQVAQLVTTDPKYLGNIYRNAHWRELRLLILYKWSFKWMYFREIQWKGIVERFWGDNYWVIYCSFWAEISYCWVQGVLLSYWTSLLFACSTSSQPRRPGTGSGVLRKRCLSALQEFGREEWPPNAVIVYPNHVLHFFVLMC